MSDSAIAPLGMAGTILEVRKVGNSSIFSEKNLKNILLLAPVTPHLARKIQTQKLELSVTEVLSIRSCQTSGWDKTSIHM